MKNFETRKQDHIRLSLDPSNEAQGEVGFDGVHLYHEAFPELDFSQIDLEQDFFIFQKQKPLMVSSMTGGFEKGQKLNLILARVAQQKNWLMGVGSQRKFLENKDSNEEGKILRKNCPHLKLFGNIGLAQLILSSPDQIQKLVDQLEAQAMIVHTNPLQECLQPEGTTQFKGGLKALERLCAFLNVPVVVKEAGCGFSEKTLLRLKDIGVKAVDLSGYGGTHWGRIEGKRSLSNSLKHKAAQTFSRWGESTVNTLKKAQKLKLNYEIWASGGVRSGLDVAKAFALGASCVGLAKPLMEQALKGEQALNDKMELIEFELKVALFCTGSQKVEDLRKDKMEFKSD